MSLAEETGVSHSSLSRWLRDAARVAANVGNDENKNARDDEPGEDAARPAIEVTRARKRPQDWTPEEKLRVIVESLRLSEDELGAFLRGNGLHDVDLKEWRSAALQSLEPQRGGKKGRKETKRIRELEKELKRKDKALAEAAALLMLEKKLQALWGAADDDTTEENEP